ncbi:MAG TPA: DinB family protein [Thermodesulfobacteriota bacterium]|nr:DinB family protein [Thermodesulfobacteriota bacterium]
MVVGDRAVHGWNPQRLAELLGVRYEPPPRLPPAELARRLDAVLAAAQRAVAQVPAGAFERKVPGRDRTARELAHHIFRLSLAFCQALDEGQLARAWLDEPPPPELRDGAALAAYGGEVRAALAARLPQAVARTDAIETPYGTQRVPELLERTAWHAAQHLRQLYALLGEAGVAPDRPLTEAELAGLPLPEALW